MPDEVVDKVDEFEDELNKEEELDVKPPDKEESKEEVKEGEIEESKETTNLSELGLRPTIQEITKEFPELFKKFPDLRTMYFREAEYTNVFPTIEAAKEAADDLDGLRELEVNLSSGKMEDIVTILGATKELSDDAIPNLSINILPALRKFDQTAYYNAITPELIGHIQFVYNSGVKFGDDNIKNAALQMAKVLFDDPDFASGKKTIQLPEAKIKKEDSDIDKERTNFRNERYDALFSDVNEDYDKSIGNFILDGLDPDEVMTPYMKNVLVEDIKRRINATLSNDNNHKNHMKNLWNQASQSGFNRSWKDRILSAALSRAKSIMPTIRTKARAEALSTKANHVKKVANSVKDRNEPLRTGTAKSGTSSKDMTAKELDEKHVSDLEFLSS